MKQSGEGRMVYLDHHATTPIDPRVLDAMLPFLTNHYANPASAHRPGRLADTALRQARRTVQHALNATNETEIIFTSGATEANTLAIVGGAVGASRPHGDHIVTTAIEHSSVHAACERLTALGYTTTRIPVDQEGHVRLQHLVEAITPRTVLVSVMFANNEIGTVQRVAQIAALAHKHQAIVHVDAVQAAASFVLDVQELGVDLLSMSSHKIYGPKGVGALYVRRGTKVQPEFAGSQEHGLRGGTTNLAGVIGLAEALDIAVSERHRDFQRIRKLRDGLEMHLLTAMPAARVNGCRRHRLPGNLSLTVPGLDAADLIEALPDVAMSSGAACSTGSSEPSHVLSAIGLSPADARATIRIGVGRPTSEDDVLFAGRRIVAAVRQML